MTTVVWPRHHEHLAPFRRPMALAFYTLTLLDLLTTTIGFLLAGPSGEQNPIALLIYAHGGLAGLWLLKITEAVLVPWLLNGLRAQWALRWLVYASVVVVSINTATLIGLVVR